MIRNTTLSLAASLLLLTGSFSPALARDDQPANQQQQRPATAQRGGLINNIPGATDQAAPTVAPALPIEEAPAPATSQQAAIPSSQQATSPALPALEPELPAAAPRTQLPALGELPSSQLPALGEDAAFDELERQLDGQLPAFGELPQSQLPALGEEAAILPPAQAMPSQVASEAPEAEKKPGFFKRMWNKVKTFYSNIKAKVTEKIASMRADRAERDQAQAAGEAQTSQQVFDADIYAGH